MRRLKSFINLKTLSFFTLTLCLGLLFNSIFGRYILRYSIVETFTQAEAEAKLNKRIVGICLDEPERGTVTSYLREDDGQISVEINWDKPIAGKFNKFNFGKETYRKCVIEIERGE